MLVSNQVKEFSILVHICHVYFQIKLKFGGKQLEDLLAWSGSSLKYWVLARGSILVS